MNASRRSLIFVSSVQRELAAERRAVKDYVEGDALLRQFSDRLEVWNPGALPPSLTQEALKLPHPSIPRNPLLAEPSFLARYIKRAGTGTLDMIRLSREASLPLPEIRFSARTTFLQSAPTLAHLLNTRGWPTMLNIKLNQAMAQTARVPISELGGLRRPGLPTF
jgi:predicted HTH transcriptional regulator